VGLRRIRVISIMEADSVTGPAKNLIEFGRQARSEVELSVVAYLRSAQRETAFIEAARDAGLHVDIVHESGRFDRSVSPKLRNLAAKHDPDIVQTHNTKSHFFLRASGIWRRRIWLAFHHGYVTTDLKMRAYHQVDRWSLRAATHVVTVCEPFVDELARRGIARERISVRHNSIRTPEPPGEAEVSRVRASLGCGAGTPVLLSVGRLSREKGHADLLGAMSILEQRGLNFHLVIVGEGPERSPLEEEIRKRRLGPRVSLVGLQHDVRPYYALAEIVALPSHSEGSPNVLLEAMIHSRGIVATRVGGVPEIVSDGESALLVPPRDSERMASAIARLLKDGELRARLAARARSIALSEYSPESYCRSLIDLYQRLRGACVRA
jgi:glycosyltransferase involved in cell wall biosynthesis